MKESKQWILKVLGISVSLPSAILGSYFFQKILVEKNYIPAWAGTGFIVLVVLYVLFLMVRYALKQ